MKGLVKKNAIETFIPSYKIIKEAIDNFEINDFADLHSREYLNDEI